MDSDHRWLEVETLFYSGRYASALIAAKAIYTEDLCTASSVRTLVTEVQEVRLEIISELLVMNRHYECGSIVFEWLAKRPNGEEDKSRLAHCYYWMDDNEKAKDIISTKETQTSLDYQTLGMIYEKQKLLAEALKSYLHALQLDLNSVENEILFDYYGNQLHVSEHTEAIVDVTEMEPLEWLSTMSNRKTF